MVKGGAPPVPQNFFSEVFVCISLLTLGLPSSLMTCVPVSSPCSFLSQILCTDVSFALNVPPGLQKIGFSAVGFSSKLTSFEALPKPISQCSSLAIYYHTTVWFSSYNIIIWNPFVYLHICTRSEFPSTLGMSAPWSVGQGCLLYCCILSPWEGWHIISA